MKYVLFIVGILAAYILGYETKSNQDQGAPNMAAAPKQQNVSKVVDTVHEANRSAGRISEMITTKTRLEVLASLGQRKNMYGAKFYCNPIDRFGSKLLNDEFIFIFGLNDTEVNQISTAIKQANNTLLEIQKNSLKIDFSAETGKLFIDVPPVPSKGGPIYDETLTVIKSVLGDERAKYFDMFSADGFDAAFNHFGVASQKLTITRDSNQSGESVYSVEAKLDYPDGYNTTKSSLNRQSLVQTYPVASDIIDRFFERTR